MTSAPVGPPAGPKAWPHPARAWWTVGVLTFAYIVSFVDRTAMSLLIGPIQADLRFNDVQLALLQGAAFGLFYTLMGLPLGWLADRVSRVRLIAAGVALWCLATAACGISRNFAQMFLARIGVGVGEAALSPAAVSLISDNFPSDRRGLPIAVYTMAVSLGAGLALVIGGLVIQAVNEAPAIHLPVLGELAGWQAVFIIIGLGGAILLPMLATVPEPERRNEKAPGSGEREAVGLWAFLLGNRRFFGVYYAGVAGCALLISGVMAWAPAFFMRAHGWTAPETGLRYGLVVMVFGPLGTIGAGYLATRLARRGLVGAPLIVCGAVMLLASPPLILAALASNGWAALAAFALATVFLAAPGGVAIQTLQDVCPNALRGRATALYFLSANIVGLTFGPLIAAALTVHVFGDPVDTGKSLAALSVMAGPITAALLFSALKPYRKLLS